jgi:glycine betaine/proline transport system substrate-binding protein
LAGSERFRRLGRGGSFIRATFLRLLLVVGVLVVGCGGGGSPENRELRIGNIGWDENTVVAQLTKVLLEDELGYGNVEIQQVDLGLVFEGVSSGDLDVFQDVWLPNHAQLLNEVEGDVVQLGDWYQGQTEFGIGVPSYMTDVTTIGDLNQSNVDQIYGIEPGSVIMERIPEEVEPAYNLQPKLVESSTAGMLSEVDRLYNDGEEFAFLPWRPHWMNQVYDFKYLEDPLDALGELNDSAEISSIVNEDLPEEDPVALAFMEAITLTEDQVNEIEFEINETGDPETGVRNWLKDNRDVVEPWLEAARNAQES